VPSSYIEQALVTLLTDSTSSPAVYAELGKKVFLAEEQPATAKPYAVLHTISTRILLLLSGRPTAGNPGYK
jgi:hypothetical protein